MKMQDKKAFSIENLLIVDTKFKINVKPYKSFLAYGGTLFRNTEEETHITELYHMMLPTRVPGSTRINTVNNIKYFAGKVAINSCDEALNFVRLLTSPMLQAPMADHLGYEVLIKEEFREDDWLGYGKEMLNLDSGYFAMITKEEAEKMKIRSAVCTRDSVYRISRYIYEWNHRDNIILFQEEVTSNGRYRIVRKTIHTHNVKSVEWRFPLEL